MRRLRGLLAASLAAACVVALAGCGGETAGAGAGGDGDSGALDWPTITEALPTDVVTWARDGSVHVGSDVVLDRLRGPRRPPAADAFPPLRAATGGWWNAQPAAGGTGSTVGGAAAFDASRAP